MATIPSTSSLNTGPLSSPKPAGLPAARPRPMALGGYPDLDPLPKGTRLGALALSLPVYGLVAGLGLILASSRTREKPPRPTLALALDVYEGAPPPPPPPPPPSGNAGASTPSHASTPELPDPRPAQEAPILEPPAHLPTGLPQGTGTSFGQPGGIPGGQAGGMVGGVLGGQVGGTLGGQLDGVLPPRFDAAYLKNPPPDYPPLSRRLGEEGRVILRVLVNAEGRAERLEVKASSGFSRLDQAVLETVRRWKFVPARHGSETIQAWVLIPITFNLEA